MTPATFRLLARPAWLPIILVSAIAATGKPVAMVLIHGGAMCLGALKDSVVGRPGARTPDWQRHARRSPRPALCQPRGPRRRVAGRQRVLRSHPHRLPRRARSLACDVRREEWQLARSDHEPKTSVRHACLTRRPLSCLGRGPECVKN